MTGETIFAEDRWSCRQIDTVDRTMIRAQRAFRIAAFLLVEFWPGSSEPRRKRQGHLRELRDHSWSFGLYPETQLSHFFAE